VRNCEIFSLAAIPHEPPGDARWVPLSWNTSGTLLGCVHPRAGLRATLKERAMPTTTTTMMTTATEVNVYERRAINGRKHYQYDFKVTMPDGEIYRERRKARGATSESAARQIGLRRMHDVLRNGPNSRKAAERPPTLAEFAPKWLAAGRAERHKPSTMTNKDVLLRCHLIPLLGHLRLHEIDQNAVELLKEKRENMSAGSVNNLIKYLIAIMHYAETKGHKVTIPARDFLPDEVEPPWYTAAEFEALVKSAATFDNADLVMILLAGEAGLRSGEVSALRWEDVDLVKRDIHVRRNLVRGHEGTPKSDKDRHVPMSRRLQGALARLRAQQGDGVRVLRRADGSDMPTDSQRTVLRRVALYAGLPAHGMHALRHCFGARLTNEGASGPKVVMKLMGHAKLTTTEKYVHASEEHCQSAIDRISPT
jgi:integrase